MSSLAGRRRLALATVAAVCLRASAAVAEDRWIVFMEARDVTAAAKPRASGDTLLVNLHGLAADLGLTVHVDGNGIRIVDATGVEWIGQHGRRSLEAGSRVLGLAVPLGMDGPSVWIAIGDAAGLAGLEAATDRQSRRAVLQRPRPRVSGRSTLGWETFTLAKPTAELAQEQSEREHERAAAVPSLLPPSREHVRLGLGLGHVAGGDGALDATLAGSFAGISTSADLFVTVGARGAQWYSGRASLVDPVHRWRADAGDLISDVDGLRRGLRLSLQRAGGHQSSVSLYLPRTFTSMRSRPMTLAYRDTFTLSRTVSVSGEVATDGSLFVTGRYITPQAALGTHYRSMDNRRGWGGMGAYNVWKGIGLTAAFDTASPEPLVEPRTTRSMFHDLGERSATYGLRVPVPGLFNLTLERRILSVEQTRVAASGMALELPLKGVRILSRIEQGTLSRTVDGRTLNEPRTEVSTIVAYAPARWASFNLTTARYFRANGTVEGRNELFANLRFSSRTSLQLMTWLDAADHRTPMRLRFAHQLTPRFDVTAEYGAFGPYQQALSHDRPELSRFACRCAAASTSRRRRGVDALEAKSSTSCSGPSWARSCVSDASATSRMTPGITASNMCLRARSSWVSTPRTCRPVTPCTAIPRS